MERANEERKKGFRKGLERASEVMRNPNQEICESSSKTGSKGGRCGKPANNGPERQFSSNEQENSSTNSDSSSTRCKLLQRTKQPTKSYKCVWYNDNDKYAVKTYNKNFKENYEAKDIRTIKASDVPEHDLLTAGFPCQAFSVAGKRLGFKDTRGTLFYEICRIAQRKKPRFLLLENVKGLLNHANGRTFAVILASLSELGYDAEWEVLNSRYFGVPQNRERVFIIGHLRGQRSKQVFPLTEDAGEVQEISGGKEMIARCLDSNMWKGVTPESYYEKSKRNLIYDRKGFDSRTKGFRESKISPTLSQKMGTGGHNVPMILGRVGNQNKYKKYEQSPTLRGLSRSDNIPKVLGDNLRRLTPVECERLQNFPDNWTEGVSDTQRYKQLGNAVTCSVIEAIGKRMLEVWEE